MINLLVSELGAEFLGLKSLADAVLMMMKCHYW